jgi:hypothetical protein
MAKKKIVAVAEGIGAMKTVVAVPAGIASAVQSSTVQELPPLQQGDTVVTE